MGPSRFAPFFMTAHSIGRPVAGDFHGAEDAVMPIAGLFVSEQSEEQKHVSFAYFLVPQMRLRCIHLSQPPMPVGKHRVIVAWSIGPDPAPR